MTANTVGEYEQLMGMGVVHPIYMQQRPDMQEFDSNFDANNQRMQQNFNNAMDTGTNWMIIGTIGGLAALGIIGYVIYKVAK